MKCKEPNTISQVFVLKFDDLCLCAIRILIIISTYISLLPIKLRLESAKD